MINGKKVIGICTSRIFDDQHHSFLEQTSERLKKSGCAMMIFTLNSDFFWDEDTYFSESYVFDIMPYDKLDCIIIMDEKIRSRTAAEKIIARAKSCSVPVVVVDGVYEGTTTISFDYERGFENVVRHVIEHHAVKRPHFMAGSRGNKFSDARLDIFRKVIGENGIEFDDSMVSYGEFWSVPAREAAERLIGSGNIPEAVICANDVMAVNVCDVFVKAGIKVPEQVIVTGFDGIDEALMTTPQITTAGCDSADLAEAVSECALRLINGEAVSSGSVLPRLCPNASCGCTCLSDRRNTSMDRFNSKFYRYQDDLRTLHDISTKMQMSGSAEQASSLLRHPVTHDMCCVVERSCFDNGRNFFAGQGMSGDRCVFFDSYHPDACGTMLHPEQFLPDIEERLDTGYPLIFNAIDYMCKPFGYICYSYMTYDINEYSRSASVTNAVSMGLGGYISMNYQKYLTEKMTAELKVAAQMQESMLPVGFAEHKRYEISASMIPAKNVGGDFYDFFQTDADHLALVIADVSGKGVPAALFMATSKLVLHERALMPGTPAGILRDVNKHICENNKMGLFVTIWFGILDLNTGILTYANAGHEYPAVKHAEDRFDFVTSDNMPPVGADENIEYEDLTIDLSGGGSLFVYTDGVTDVKNAAGEHFGIERVDELLNRYAGKSPEDVIRGVTDGIDDFAGETERFDDTTMLCVRFKGND